MQTATEGSTYKLEIPRLEIWGGIEREYAQCKAVGISTSSKLELLRYITWVYILHYDDVALMWRRVIIEHSGTSSERRQAVPILLVRRRHLRMSAVGHGSGRTGGPGTSWAPGTRRAPFITKMGLAIEAS